MKPSKRIRTTRLTELVETHNIATSLARIADTSDYGALRRKRAIYHALAMNNGLSREELAGVRPAMNLP